jgi:hypothetical protein
MSEYSCEKWFKLKYSVKFMGDCVEGKGRTSKITKSMCCSFDTDMNIKLMVIKHAGEISNCTVAR